jgi:pimeloyl-ACP methyl ester carboxylesterase
MTIERDPRAEDDRADSTEVAPLDGDVIIESADGTRLAASCAGSGSPLVLAHGALLGREAWQFVVPHLVGRHTVWSYDRRGHGRSDRAEDMAMDREVEDLTAVMAVAGADVHVMGHSFGALVCLEAAARGIQGMRSLVVYEPTVHFERCGEALRRSLELLAGNDLEGFVEVFLTDVAAVDRSELAMMRSSPAAWDLLIDAARNYRDLRDVFTSSVNTLLSTHRVPKARPSVTVPTLLVMGALTDSQLFATLDEVRAVAVRTEVVRLDGQRHMAAVFDPTGLADAVLTFTSAHDPTASEPMR